MLIRNTSPIPLTINAVVPSCKCTTLSDLVGKEIPPGSTVELKVKLDGAPAMGVRRSSVKISVNGYGRALEVAVKAEVTMPVRIVPPYINTVDQKNLTGRVIVESIDRAPFKILSTLGAPVSIQGFDAAVDAPRNSYIVAYDLESLSADLPPFIYFETDAPGAAVVDARVRHLNAPKKPLISTIDTRCNLGSISANVPAEALFTVVNGSVVIQGVTTTSKDATVALARTEPTNDRGINVFVTVTPRSGFSGILLLPIVLTTATHPASLEVVASVKP